MVLCLSSLYYVFFLCYSIIISISSYLLVGGWIVRCFLCTPKWNLCIAHRSHSHRRVKKSAQLSSICMLMLKGMHVQFPYFSRAASTNFYSYAVLLWLISFQLWEFIKTSVCFSLSSFCFVQCMRVCVYIGWCCVLMFKFQPNNNELENKWKFKREKKQNTKMKRETASATI